MKAVPPTSGAPYTRYIYHFAVTDFTESSRIESIEGLKISEPPQPIPVSIVRSASVQVE